MPAHIRTNNVPREVIDGYQLNAKERSDFDYLNWGAIDDGCDSASFVRYKGQLIDLGTFERIPADTQLSAWSGYCPDSFFSGTVLRWADNGCETVVMGWYVHAE